MHKKKEAFSLRTTIILLVVVFLLGIGGVTFYYAFYKVVNMRIYDLEIKVVEDRHIGFNADPTLHFGMLPMTGGTSEKQIIINNSNDIPVRVDISLSGDAAGYVSVEDNHFTLKPLEIRNIKAYATIPNGVFFEKVNITGEAKVKLIRI